MTLISIIGASARAAAASARRAGLSPWCADLFADQDLRASAAHVVRCPVDRYPNGFLEILRDSPDCPWMYTGGLENHPDLIQRMAKGRPLWGNGPDALAACRSPWNLASTLSANGLPSLEVRDGSADLPRENRWVKKPIGGSAGMGIAFADTKPLNQSVAHYLQQFVDGPSMSAVFVRVGSQSQLLGVAEQLIGTQWLNAMPFRYAGNIGPIVVSPELDRELMHIGSCLGKRFGLLGLFGVDFILNDGRPWVVEINPRYPASIEVHEQATGVSAMQLHRAAFDKRRGVDLAALRALPHQDFARGSDFALVGKGILYARNRFVVGSSADMPSPDDFVKFADIPSPGEVIEAGWPVLTILTRAKTSEACRRKLIDAATVIDRRLFGLRSHQ